MTRQRTEQSGTSGTIGRREPEFEPDYEYVIKDLKRIGLYAGICLAILLILFFII
jgi:hypothetical protein